ncbi:hypothetical protein FD27_GL000481 [Limosilactobacillus frumenti DSM 13145]|uniref:Uroporphyrin-III c-methyltransferase n=1 Tax=Limosilactobacillus frumenti DSM 13145 TaxID=1423746 RepID=A0A0R1P665_9LACO|nr:DUF488 family protein [Limosilactobacillus frumenti]KRL27740.1 hypothetical protein FD27_GL000481 [Limosilactobacillus frumenti DSM 13145]MBA2913949.1 DUF488 family protein [Limosilactobacillus frumenti]QFG73298.1 DUF488 family protein [Limosilactobacillus frumenti]
MKLKLERIYTKPADLNGYRILVDRLWPRGISKVNAHLDQWLKEVGPSNDLRKWFNHDLAKYPEFQQRYLAELDKTPAPYNSLRAIVKEQIKQQDVILLFGAKDVEHNQAVVLANKLAQDLNVEVVSAPKPTK